jgi:hypothetical protein
MVENQSTQWVYLEIGSARKWISPVETRPLIAAVAIINNVCVS